MNVNMPKKNALKKATTPHRQPLNIKRANLGLFAPFSPLKILDLTEIQRESYQQLLQIGLTQILNEVNPIYDYTGKNHELNLSGLTLGRPKLKPWQALQKGLSYQAPLLARARLTDLETGQSQTQEVFLGEIPLMTPRATFIINGHERVVVNQLTRAPGVYFEEIFDPTLKRKLYIAEIRPERGSWLGFEVDRNDVLWARINRAGRRIPATVFLKAFGFKPRELSNILKSTDANRDFLTATLYKDPSQNQDEAFLDIYSRVRPGDPRILENARSFFEGLFFEPRRFSLGKVGRFKLNKRLKLSFPPEPNFLLLQKEDLAAILLELIHLTISQEKGDDIDHLCNRRLRSVGELTGQSFRVGLLRLERNIRERLSVSAPDKKLTPVALVNARPIVASLNEFFGSSQLSQFMDQTNPLSELSHLRTVSALGPGGLTRERAGTAVRDLQPSHYSRLCAIQTPEGQNIGLRLYLAIFSQIDEFGFLRAPYLKVEKRKNGNFVIHQIEYLAADEEENYHIAEATVPRNAQGKILPPRVLTRFKGDFRLAESFEIDYIDAHPSQILAISAGLIPFVSSDMGNRALMGANMQVQAVPLINPEAPRVGTGFEGDVAKNCGQVTFAKNAGEVCFMDANRIEVRRLDRGLDVYYLKKFMRTNENTTYNETPRVSLGQKVNTGQALVDGCSSQAGELALGRDLLAAFIPWDGFNYEDSVVISERLVREDLLSSIHIKEYEANLMDTKLGPEELTRDIPNVSEESLRNLDEGGLIVIGAKVNPGDILVGKIAPKGETELTAEERLLRAIFGEKAREIRDTSLRMAHGDRGVVISVQILEKAKGDELPPGVLQSIKVKVAQKRKIQVGDKIAGRHGSKGVVAKIVAQEDMPYILDGTPIDILLNPISILARLNIGQLLETHLAWAGKILNEYYAIPPFDKLEEGIIQRKLKEANLPISGKVQLIDGRSGEPFENEVMVGFAHILKLHHLVEDKVHARSTGPYSLITQQPLGGKAQMGGQRLGEMEVWALEAYGAAHILQEMLTIKSDDVVGRQKAFEAIIKGVPIPEARIPEAFKLLTRELNSLGLGVDTLKFEDEGKKVITEEAEELIGEAQ